MANAVKLAQFVSNAVAASGKSEEQIAKEVGYGTANVITILKGTTTAARQQRERISPSGRRRSEGPHVSCARGIHA
jgi:hypothetical protein